MDGGGDEIIDLLGIDLGYSLLVICPPVAECGLCEKRLANEQDRQFKLWFMMSAGRVCGQSSHIGVISATL